MVKPRFGRFQMWPHISSPPRLVKDELLAQNVFENHLKLKAQSSLISMDRPFLFNKVLYIFIFTATGHSLLLSDLTDWAQLLRRTAAPETCHPRITESSVCEEGTGCRGPGNRLHP